MNSLYQFTVNYIYYFITRLRVLLNNTHKNVTKGEVNIDDHTYLQLEKLVLSDTFELEIGLMLLRLSSRLHLLLLSDSLSPIFLLFCFDGVFLLSFLEEQSVKQCVLKPFSFGEAKTAQKAKVVPFYFLNA